MFVFDFRHPQSFPILSPSPEAPPQAPAHTLIQPRCLAPLSTLTTSYSLNLLLQPSSGAQSLSSLSPEAQHHTRILSPPPPAAFFPSLIRTQPSLPLLISRSPALSPTPPPAGQPGFALMHLLFCYQCLPRICGWTPETCGTKTQEEGLFKYDKPLDRT